MQQHVAAARSIDRNAPLGLTDKVDSNRPVGIQGMGMPYFLPLNLLVSRLVNVAAIPGPIVIMPITYDIRLAQSDRRLGIAVSRIGVGRGIEIIVRTATGIVRRPLNLDRIPRNIGVLKNIRDETAPGTALNIFLLDLVLFYDGCPTVAQLLIRLIGRAAANGGFYTDMIQIAGTVGGQQHTLRSPLIEGGVSCRSTGIETGRNGRALGLILNNQGALAALRDVESIQHQIEGGGVVDRHRRITTEQADFTGAGIEDVTKQLHIAATGLQFTDFKLPGH